MTLKHWSWRRPAALVAVALAMVAQPAAAARHALLVGIADYGGSNNLEGPVNDVTAMQRVLVQRWAVPAENVRTLVDRQATRENILAALRELSTRTREGDEVVIFFSGHGTSALDADQVAALPDGTGAFIPYGTTGDTPQARAESFIVGSRDLRPLLSALDQGGRRVWFISDSCFSGNQARSAGLFNLPPRLMALPGHVKLQNQQAYVERRRAGYTPPGEYPYRNVAFLAASSEGELAVDIKARFLPQFPTITGKPQGVLTDALLRVLEGQIPGDLDRDGYLTLAEVHQAVSDFIGARGFPQTPQRRPSVRDDAADLGSRPVLSVRGVAAPLPGKGAAQVAPLAVHWQEGATELSRLVEGLPGVRRASQADAALIVGPSRRSPDRVAVTSRGELLAEYPRTNPRALRAKLMQFAWVHRMGQLAQRHQRGLLHFEMSPGDFGGTFVFGEHLRFSTRVPAPAWLVLLNVDSDGKVSVLYPQQPSEMAALSPGEVHTLPPIRVQEPEGQDMLIALAFEQWPEGLDRLRGAVRMETDDPRLAQLESWLTSYSGRFRYAPNTLRAVSQATVLAR